MSLLNLMFVRNVLQIDLKIANQLSFSDISLNKNSSLTNIKHSLYTRSSFLPILLIAKNDNSLYESFDDFANKSLISRNFLTNLINKYWQETIFLSKSNTVSDYYTNQLRSDGIAIYKKQYKKFLFDFSKALIKGRIEASLVEENNSDLINKNTDIKYIWRKGLNFPPQKKIFSFILNKRRVSFPSKLQIELIKKLKQNKLPIFTVINNFNQMIISEPSDQLIDKKNILDTIYQWYHDYFLWYKDEKPIYEGLFFVNSEDALEYQEYIKQKYVNSGKQNNLSIFASGLDFYYKLVRISPPRVQFHLIPDLKELSKLICKYQYNKNITFHDQQEYGKNFFQGQPIYLIQPVLAKNKQTKQIDLVNYSYKVNQYSHKKSYKAIFMNYKVALMAWKKFVNKMVDYHLPDNPKIQVYNLEDFLKMHEDNRNLSKNEFLFIPTEESYQFVKMNILQKSQQNISRILINKFFYLKIMTQRIIWSLTSRQPINW